MCRQKLGFKMIIHTSNESLNILKQICLQHNLQCICASETKTFILEYAVCPILEK